MSQHDKHQYYFEKYLRNEMPEADRTTFDEKLAEDASLRMAFEYYRLNRETLLAELIKEHKLTRRDNRFNKLIFLLISLTGIALTFNYFVYRQPVSSTNPQPSKGNILIRYIPFLNKEPKPKPQQPATTPIAVPRKHAAKDTITRFEPSIDRDERLRSDLYQRDSFVTVQDQTSADAWFAYWQQSDLLGVDSAERPAFIKNNKTPILLVEYWESPFGYKGYFLQKNTLVLYGIHQPKIILYKEQNELFLMLPGSERIVLTEQPNFTSF